MFDCPGSSPWATTRQRSSSRSSTCIPADVVARSEPLPGAYAWIAFRFQFHCRLFAFASDDVPGVAEVAWKKSSGGANTSFDWPKRSMPPAAMSLRLWCAVCAAWNVSVPPPVNRVTTSSFFPKATVCNGLEPR